MAGHAAKSTNGGPRKSNVGSKTLGPVSDLERHLPVEWWRKLFNAVYLKTDGDVVENERNTVEDVDQLIRETGINQETRVLDLCCGQGRHCLELAKRGFAHVTGIDRSRYLVRLARRRSQKLGYSINFREGDARKFRLPEQSQDCVTLFGNSFGYFEQSEDDLLILKSVSRVLRPGGRIVLDVVEGEWMRKHFDARSWEWIDENHFVCRERALASDEHRLISREVVTHAERGVIADQFYAERLYSFAELEELLREAGFEGMRRCASPETDSSRRQDLGMMATRMFIVASKPTRTVPARRSRHDFSEVTVLLGDPSLPDMVKRGAQFNPEDFATIDKLRDALEAIPGYKFKFWNDHHALLKSLTEEPPKFVLNLCDEGFLNDAFKELHVPALFEMLGIPYSGAGPTCLGLCYNKSYVRALAQGMDMPVPLESYFAADDQVATLPSVFPALLKPNWGDSSLGITKDAVVNTQQQFMSYWETLRNEFPGRSLLVQEYLTGPEYSVGIVGNPGFNLTVLPVLEVDYSGLDPGLPKILGYESKWMPDSPYWSQIKYKQAKLDESKRRQLVDHSLLLFERLEFRDYGRFDYRADDTGVIKLLEANPNPGWCWDGKLNFMAEYANYSYSDLLRMIIEAARERYESAGDRLVPAPALVAAHS